MPTAADGGGTALDPTVVTTDGAQPNPDPAPDPELALRVLEAAEDAVAAADHKLEVAEADVAAAKEAQKQADAALKAARDAADEAGED
jgi:hypothetical protein